MEAYPCQRVVCNCVSAPTRFWRLTRILREFLAEVDQNSKTRSSSKTVRQGKFEWSPNTSLQHIRL